MKLLRNPVVVSVLAVVAVVMVFYQVLKPQWQRYRIRGGASPPAVALTPPPAVSSPSPAAVPLPASAARAPAAKVDLKAIASVIAPPPKTAPSGSPINVASITNRLTLWTEAPARDPFRLFVPEVSDDEAPEAPSPVSQWVLKAIWRQTGERVAAINNGIYKEGDRIEQYRVERIEGDTVWLEGTNRIEHLGFRTGQTTNTTKRTPRSRPSR